MLFEAGREETPRVFWIVEYVAFGDSNEAVGVCHSADVTCICSCSSVSCLCLRFVSRVLVRPVIYFLSLGGRGE